jgi:hypothetical protein
VADDRVAPSFPRLPRVERVEERALGIEDALALEGRDRGDQLALAAGEVVKELALARRGPGADVVEAGAADAAGEDEVRGRLDDAGAGRLALRREIDRLGNTVTIALWTGRSIRVLALLDCAVQSAPS